MWSASSRTVTSIAPPAPTGVIVAGTVATGMYEYDNLNMYARIEAVQSLLQLPPDTISMLAVNIDDPWNSDEVARRIQACKIATDVVHQVVRVLAADVRAQAHHHGFAHHKPMRQVDVAAHRHGVDLQPFQKGFLGASYDTPDGQAATMGNGLAAMVTGRDTPLRVAGIPNARLRIAGATPEPRDGADPVDVHVEQTGDRFRNRSGHRHRGDGARGIR